jgi:hypothetical protein
MAFRTSVLTKKDQRYADGHQQDSHPPLEADSFMQKDDSSDGSGNVTQCRYRNNKADVVQGQRSQQSKEGERHHEDTGPHPWLAKRSTDDPDDLRGTEAGCLTNALHRARDAQFAPGSSQHDHRKQSKIPQSRFASQFRWRSSAERYGL